MKNIIVIGGGASGMMAAIAASANGAKVTIIEQNAFPGKKILSTGNGRCNYTNFVQTPSCYRSDDPQFPWQVIRQFDEQKTVGFLLDLGICPKERNGYLYPNSDQAQAVADALVMECERLSIRIRCNTTCQEIISHKHGFRVRTETAEPEEKSGTKDKNDRKKAKKNRPVPIKTTQNTWTCDAVILAAGSKASNISGSDGSGYDLAKSLGHSIIPVLPALVQLHCAESFYKEIAGIRVQGRVTLYVREQKLAEDTGEIQLTNYGISGIPVFQVSRFAAKALYEKKPVKAVLNFMPDISENTCFAFLKERISTRPEKTLNTFLVGLFPKKLGDLLLRLSRLDLTDAVRKLSDEDIRKLAYLIQHFETTITKTNAYEQAQICCGGVDTREVDPETMESRYVPGIYFAGELLDVDGICGGYNLQWAWSSGYVAGRSAGSPEKENEKIRCLESIS